MYTIKDYLKYYKNTPLEQVSWNEADNLLCAILVYLPLDSYTGSKSLQEFSDYAKGFKGSPDSSVMAPHAYNCLEEIIKGTRYQSLEITNFTRIKNEDTQFGAATFRLNKLTIISYKGTDGSLIGWIENFRLGYQYPTNTHLLAIKYLHENITTLDENVYLVGHSKGGNLAMVSAMESTPIEFNKIKNIYNFDGPGFKKEEYESKKYHSIHPKLINIIPQTSLVGMILNNNNYRVIKSNEFAFDEHYPTSWCLFGEYFIEGELSSISLQLHESTTTGVEELDQEKMAEAFETIFKSLEKEYSSKLKITFTDLKNFYLNMKDVDPEIKKYLDTIFDSMFKALYSRERDPEII